MEEKLNTLYKECTKELKEIGLDFEDEEKYGTIDIKFAKRNAKRYGCCKQENPDKETKYWKNKKIQYKKFNTHHIEISRWVMDLNNEIIKNTIIHELIHCIPNCSNHGKDFKFYAKLVNDNLGYNITRVGNKENDYKNSGLEFCENEKKLNYNYKIVCKNCGQTYFRQRMKKGFLKKYLCGICKRRFKNY